MKGSIHVCKVKEKNYTVPHRRGEASSMLENLMPYDKIIGS